MALLFFEDFETDGAAFWGEGNGSAESSIVYAGLVSWKFVQNVDWHAIGDTHEIWLDFYWRTDATTINAHHIASFMADFFLIAGLRVSTGQKLAIYNGTTLIATGATTIDPGVWYHIAIHILRDDTSGVFDVDLDGTSEITFAGDTGPNDFNRLRFGSGNASTDWYDNISGYDAEPVATVPTVVIDSDFSVAGASGIGIRVIDTAQIYQSRASGLGYDFQVDASSTAQADDLTLVNATQNIAGTLNPLRSDRATWDTSTYFDRHASDIQADSFTYHTDPANPPLSRYLGSGSFFVGNGSDQAVGVTMSGDATLDNTGVLTISPQAIDASNVAMTNGSIFIGGGDGAAHEQAISGDISIDNAGVTTISAKAVDASNLSITNGSIFIGGADGAAHEQSIAGDASISNAGLLTLATVNADVGTYGDSTHLAQITVDAKGRITAIGTIVFTGGGSEVLMADGITPPDPLTTEGEDDWLYEG